jgi:hypothetical protein
MLKLSNLKIRGTVSNIINYKYLRHFGLKELLTYISV